MSIRIGLNPSDPYINYALQDTIVLNANNPDNKVLLYLLSTSPSNQSYIQLGTSLLFGSSNNNFVVADLNYHNMWEISTGGIAFNQPAVFNNDVQFNNILITSNTTHIYNDVTIDIGRYTNSSFTVANNDASIISVVPSKIDITNDTLNIHSSNVTFDHAIRTNRIRPLVDGSNVIIDGIILNNFETMAAVFKNSILVDYNSIPNGIVDNTTSLKIVKNNTCNFAEMYDYESLVMHIDRNGCIGINTDTTDTAINVQQTGRDYTIKCNDTTYIDRRGHVSIGKIKPINNIKTYQDIVNRQNDSMLYIHRSDSNAGYEIISDPLIHVSMDYDQNNNIITQNISNVLFTPNKIHPIIDKTYQIDTNFSIVLNYLPFSYNNIQFYKESLNVISTTLNTLNGMKLYTQSYNYGGYTLYQQPITYQSGLIIDSSNVNVLGGLWLTNEQDFINQLNNLNALSPNYNVFRYTCNIQVFPDVIFNPSYSYDLTLNIYFLVELSQSPIYIPFIDTTPKIVPPPDFLRLEYNNAFVGNIDAGGMMTLGSTVSDNYKFWTDSRAYINKLHTNYITCNVDFTQHDIHNINSITTNHLSVDSDIDIAGIVTINRDYGMTIYQGTTTLSTIYFDNIISSNLKYDLYDTVVLNDFSVVDSYNATTFRSYRSRIPYNLYIEGKGMYIEGDGVHINSSNTSPYLILQSRNGFAPSISLNHADNGFDIDYNILTYDTQQELIAQPTRYLYYDTLRTIDNHSNSYLKAISALQEVSFGNDDFICASVSKSLNKLNIGIPTESMQLLNQNVDDWYKHFDNYNFQTLPPTLLNLLRAVHDDVSFVQTSHMNHPLTTYGNVRFSDTNNLTLMELRQYDSLYGTSLPTLNVFGNIKCRPRRSNVNAQNQVINVAGSMALEVMGAASFEDKIYTIGGVASLSDRSVKTDLQVIRDSVEKISRLNGYTYLRTDTNKRETGLIAQEVQSVLPEATSKDATDRLNISYGNLCGILVEAIKELNQRIHVLEDTIRQNKDCT